MTAPNTNTTTLRSLVAERMFPLGEGFTDDCDLYAEGLDSMALMQLILLLEQEMGVRIGPEDLAKENFQSLAAIAALVERKQVK